MRAVLTRVKSASVTVDFFGNKKVCSFSNPALCF